MFLFTDAEGAGADLQRKLDLLNGALDAERAEQARRQMQYIAHSGYSEDSDYTSDLNYPVGQHPNCSASQFRSAAHQIHTPQRSLEASRENSYERDDYHTHADDRAAVLQQPAARQQKSGQFIFITRSYLRMECWSQYQPELRQASIESAVSWRTAADWHSTEEQRRPSLERQNTLYDDLCYGYETYASSHIGERDQLSHQPSYEEYYDTSSVYQTSYVAGWGYGGAERYDDAPGKRRSSVVQLPQVPHKQAPASSRYSDYNGMAPYRPRTRRVAASLPATPSSTPKRSRALPMPPGVGSAAGRGQRRRLPRLPYPPPHHVPYTPESEKTIPDVSYRYNIYGCQQQCDTTFDQQDVNYTGYDEDGMQPFFDETPHATPPAITQRLPQSDSETANRFAYTAREDDELYSKSLPTTTTYSPQLPITSQQKYEDQILQYDDQFSILNQHFSQEYQENQPYISYEQQVFEQQPDFITKQNFQIQNYQQQEIYEHQQTYEKQESYEQQQSYQQSQSFQQQQQYQQSQSFQQQQQQQYQQHQQQQKSSSQQLQTTMLTGAATLGSMFAGGAKKLGSLFGAAAAAVAPPPVSQPPSSAVTTSQISTTSFTSAIAPVTPFTTATTTLPAAASVPEVSPSVPVSGTATASPATLPRTPSLRRQESIQRPSVRRTRTLPEAPDDLAPTAYDESAYDDECHKTEYDEHRDHDRTSLDRYYKDEFVSDSIPEESIDNRIIDDTVTNVSKEPSLTRNVTVTRKSSVDSYSSAQGTIERRISQSSYHQEDKLSISTTQEDERTTYDEVPDERKRFDDIQESFDEQQDNYQDDVSTYHQEDDRFHEDEKFEQEQFEKQEERYREEDAVFEESQDRRKEEHVTFQEGQPKLTPKQRWHRAYNKIVMQLNKSASLRSESVKSVFRYVGRRAAYAGVAAAPAESRGAFEADHLISPVDLLGAHSPVSLRTPAHERPAREVPSVPDAAAEVEIALPAGGRGPIDCMQSYAHLRFYIW
ncbi:hypothetical protein EVAR_38011_1 [Eumeta japonica]|uniref:Uncharacterized protein n=1 Tax=Eumeta variegata TaxID=151549 RepID=A0A4C1WUX9_EUMVA|nr:hypothetical protein EVAR_38011_1 [Eumeta japonica]